MKDNIILLTDSYKVTHWKQYPPNTQHVYSYFESRGGLFESTLFFGLQYLLKRYLEGQVIDYKKIEYAQNLLPKHFSGNKGLFNTKGWHHIMEKHNGSLPVSIKAVPEGTIVPTHNVLMTIENTCSECYWVTNYLETLLVQTWYPTTVATLSWHIRKLIETYLIETGGKKEDALFKLHDFGFRGVSSVESAMLGDASHLINFRGTDVLLGIELIREYYRTDTHYDNSDMPGFSIPAAEHSTITSWGKDHELEAFDNMLTQYPDGYVAVVSDSFDIFKACSDLWGDKLKSKVINRNGTVVIRPDSGLLPDTIISVLKILNERFGSNINDKGYKTLDSHVRVIQGDGVNYDSIGQILKAMKIAGYATENIAFGMGGSLLQRLDRDTQKFAFKCSAICVNNKWRDVYKEPITDLGKNSKAGRLKLVKTRNDYKFVTLREDGYITGVSKDYLVEVFRDGKLLVNHTFEQIRDRVKQQEKSLVLI